MNRFWSLSCSCGACAPFWRRRTPSAPRARSGRTSSWASSRSPPGSGSHTLVRNCIYRVEQNNSCMFEIAAFLPPTNLRQPMHSPSALTEHVSLNLAWFFLLHAVGTIHQKYGADNELIKWLIHPVEILITSIWYSDLDWANIWSLLYGLLGQTLNMHVGSRYTQYLFIYLYYISW